MGVPWPVPVVVHPHRRYYAQPAHYRQYRRPLFPLVGVEIGIGPFAAPVVIVDRYGDEEPVEFVEEGRYIEEPVLYYDVEPGVDEAVERPHHARKKHHHDEEEFEDTYDAGEEE